MSSDRFETRHFRCGRRYAVPSVHGIDVVELPENRTDDSIAWRRNSQNGSRKLLE